MAPVRHRGLARAAIGARLTMGHDAFDPRRRRWFRPIWRSDVADEVRAELQFHLDMRTSDYAVPGRSRDAARELARQRLGDLEAVAGWLQAHDTRQLRVVQRRETMHDLWQDLRHAIRQLRRAPAFAVITVATLALAIGATTAVISVVDGVLLRPLPFNNLARIVHIDARDRAGEPDDISPLDLADLRTRNRTFAALAAVQANQNANLTARGLEPVRISDARVGAEFFAILGARAARGRFFRRGEDSAGSGQVMVLSWGAWQRLFGADSSVIGRTVRLNDRPFTVIGVAPADLVYPAHADAWVPAVWEPWEVAPINRGLHELEVIGLLKPGTALPAAKGDLARVVAQVNAEYPNGDPAMRWSASPLTRTILGDVRTPLVALLGAVIFVLLIACANVANLLLVRGAARQGEFAVRISLGAARGRMVRQLLTESMLLWTAGAIGGILLAGALIRVVITFGPADLPRIDNIRLNLAVLGMTAAATLCTGIGFGLIPAVHTVRSSLDRTLRRAGRDGATAAARRTREGLVLAEVALSLILLVGAGLLLRSFDRLIHVTTGFRPDGVVVFDVGTNASNYPRDVDTRRFTDGLRTQLARIPGTHDVAVAAARPLDRDGSFEVGTSFTVAGRPPALPADKPAARVLPVSAEYFRTLGIQMLRGRTFTTAEEGPEVPPVVVVNQALVRRYFRGQDPIGQRIELGLTHTIDEVAADSFHSRGEIVGVVDDVKLDSLTDAPAPTVYVGYGTLPFEISFVMRSSAPLGAVAPAIRAAVHAADAGATVYGLNTLRRAVSETAVRPRFYTLLLSAFAAAALLIATLGIYGVISHGVAQQQRALGIRVALGASRERIIGDVLRNALVVTVIGLGLGLLGAVAVTRAMAGMLYGTSPLDPVIFALAPVVLLAIGMLAAWFPARRASRVDPVVAIRAE